MAPQVDEACARASHHPPFIWFGCSGSRFRLLVVIWLCRLLAFIGGLAVARHIARLRFKG